MNKKRKSQILGEDTYGQISIEYLIVVSFVTFAIIGILTLSYFYSEITRDRIMTNQIEVAMKKIISSSESVFYSGEPSKATITVYIPKGVNNITIQNKSLILEIRTRAGVINAEYTSKVELNGTISSSQGVKKISIEAQQGQVKIN